MVGQGYINEWMFNNPIRKSRKLKVMEDLMWSLTDLSTCNRNHTACVIFPRDFSRVYSMGFNGVPAGNFARCTGEEGNCLCCHAEVNALIKLNERTEGLVMLTRLSPCWYCAGAIVNSKQISLVVYMQQYRETHGLSLLQDGGIYTCHFERLMQNLGS